MEHSQTNETPTILFLHSAPVVATNGPGQIRPLPILDASKDEEVILRVLNASNYALRFKSIVASVEQVTNSLLDKSTRLIHYAGHGIRDLGMIILENNFGEQRTWEANVLQRSLNAAQTAGKTRLVFVSACYSENTGNVFVNAGIPHVVAVKNANRVSNQAARDFTQTFYYSLMQKCTVQQAFDIAQGRTRIETGHSNDVFVLLPRDAPHDEVIFDDLVNGEVLDVTNPSSIVIADTFPSYFCLKNLALHRVYKYFVEDVVRVVTLQGQSGIGKTSLALRAIEYLTRRGQSRNIFDAVFQISLNKYIKRGSSYNVETILDCIVQSIPPLRNSGITIRSVDDLIDILNEGVFLTDLRKCYLTSNPEGAVSANILPSQRNPRVLLLFDGCDVLLDNSDTKMGKADAVFNRAYASSMSLQENAGVRDPIHIYGTESKASQASMPPPPQPISSIHSIPASAMHGSYSAPALDEVGRADIKTGAPPVFLQFLNSLLRHTRSVKFLLTTTDPIVPENGNFLLREHDKTVTVEPFSDPEIAGLLIRISPHPIEVKDMLAAAGIEQQIPIAPSFPSIPSISSLSSSNAPSPTPMPADLAIEIFSQSKIVKSLHGNPRAAKFFAQYYLKKYARLDDSALFLDAANESYQRAICFDEFSEFSSEASALQHFSVGENVKNDIVKGQHGGGGMIDSPNMPGTSAKHVENGGSVPPESIEVEATVLDIMYPPSMAELLNGEEAGGNAQSQGSEQTPMADADLMAGSNGHPQIPVAEAVPTNREFASYLAKSFGSNPNPNPSPQNTPGLRLSETLNNGVSGRNVNVKSATRSSPEYDTIDDTALADSEITHYLSEKLPNIDHIYVDIWLQMSMNLSKEFVPWENVGSALEKILVGWQIDSSRQSGVSESTSSPPRALCEDDLKFLAEKAGCQTSTSAEGKQVQLLSREAYRTFLEWWVTLTGDLLQSIKSEFGRTTNTGQQLVHGFLGRESAERLLISTRTKGTFLLRFSERHPQRLVLSFLDVDSSGSRLKVVQTMLPAPKGGLFEMEGSKRTMSLSELILRHGKLKFLYPNIEKRDAFR
jgi:hypothetical protein